MSKVEDVLVELREWVDGYSCEDDMYYIGHINNELEELDEGDGSRGTHLRLAAFCVEWLLARDSREVESRSITGEQYDALNASHTKIMLELEELKKKYLNLQGALAQHNSKPKAVSKKKGKR